MSEPPFVCWLDLETTGADPEIDPIIEVGYILCRNEYAMPVVDEGNWVVGQPGDFWERFDGLAPVVREMHQANGLWAEVRASALRIAGVDDEFSSILKAHCGTNHVALAGSGVSHFDRRFIRAQMPRTDKRFTYWAYDVGVVRRMMQRVSADLVRPIPGGSKAHRATADAYDHRIEWLHYEELIGGGLA